MMTVLLTRSPFLPLFSGWPLFTYRDKHAFRFVTSADQVGRRDPNRILILLRWLNSENPERPADPKKFLLELRDHYDKIVLFDDDDSTSTPYAALLPFVDFLWKKQLLRDRLLYMAPLYGNRIFSDYYHRLFGVEEPSAGSYDLVENEADLKKFRLAWGLGIGSYPLRHWRELAVQACFPWLGRSVARIFAQRPSASETFDSPKQDFCQARFAEKGYSVSIGYQRALLSERLRGMTRVRQGFIARRDYGQEMGKASAVLSPFGWGEVCYRDFEAIRNGSILIKPSMEHLETWPETYVPGQTYVPVRWDATDLETVVDDVLDNPTRYESMKQNALDAWLAGYREVERRLEALIKELL